MKFFKFFYRMWNGEWPENASKWTMTGYYASALLWSIFLALVFGFTLGHIWRAMA